MTRRAASPGWGAVAARARGLAGRLLPAAALRELERSHGLEPLRRALAARGLPLPAAADAVSCERALAANAGAELRTLDRWLSPRQREALAPVFADEDRRSLRRVLRGLAAGVPPARRAAGTLATPTLPASLLAAVARQPTPGAAAALLVATGHPLGAPLAAACAGDEPGLLQLELALDRAVAGAAAAALAREGGGGPLGRLYRRLLDGGNLAAALALAAAESELPVAGCLTAGGSLPLAALAAAAAAGSPEAAARLLSPSTRGATRAALASGEAPRRLGAALLADALREQRALALSQPLSAAPVLAWLLAQRAEVAALRRAAWRLTFEPGERSA